MLDFTAKNIIQASLQFLFQLLHFAFYWKKLHPPISYFYIISCQRFYDQFIKLIFLLLKFKWMTENWKLHYKNIFRKCETFKQNKVYSTIRFGVYQILHDICYGSIHRTIRSVTLFLRRRFAFTGYKRCTKRFENVQKFI